MRSLVAAVSGTIVAAVVVGLAEAIPTLTGSPTPPRHFWASLPIVAIGTVVAVLWAPLAFSAFLDLSTLRARREKATTLLTAGVLAVSVAFNFYWYDTLVAYEPFRDYIPFQLGLVAALALFTLHWWINAIEPGEGLMRHLPVVANIAVIGAGIATQVANYLVYPGLYPTLHAAASLLSAALLVRGLSTQFSYLPRRVAVGAGAAATVVLIACTAAALFVGEGVSPYFHHSSELGRLASMNRDFEERAAVSGGVRRDTTAVVRFADANSLPDLGPDFRLEDHNILVIAAEATRYDKTSLAPDGPDTTPNLARAAQDGWVAHRAYSPSSGTLHSLASLFTMKYPFAVDLVTWMQPWTGELAESEETAAEILSDSGYDTFWIGHNHNLAFTRALLGLTQGFQELGLVEDFSNPHSPNTDARIARRTTRKLRELARKPDERFFGFVFLTSPHGPYLSHGYDDLPDRSDADRYLQEIRNVDEQFHDIFETLRETALLDNTVVVFLSDHGEEFGEHGGVRHKATVYTESIRVPFVVWVPGLEPASTDRPVSILYLFPWLFVRAESDTIRQPAVEVLETLIGPVLRETNNAVVAELLGHDRIKATLVYERLKLNYDYRSRLFELYDVTVDPLEQKDIFPDGDAGEILEHFEQLDGIRSTTKRYRFDEEKQAPSIKEFQKTQQNQREGGANP